MMNTQIKHILALCRHFGIKGSEVMSRIVDYTHGIMKFLFWAPTVLLRVIAIYARKKSRQGKNFDLEAHNKLEHKFRVVFINLDRRPDRRRETERELGSLGLHDAERIQAISDVNGALGCARSHLKVISNFAASGESLLLVCEDDIELNCNREELMTAVAEFIAHPELDVLCLGFRLRAPQLPITRNLAVANGIQTTLCYLVKAQAGERLARAFQRSERMLSKGRSPRVASIDQQWKKEQTQDLMFCVPRKKLILHRASFSDITGREKDYNVGTFSS